MLALADELAEDSELDTLRGDGDLLAAVALEVVPLAVVIGREPALRCRRRQQIFTRKHSSAVPQTNRNACCLLMSKRS